MNITSLLKRWFGKRSISIRNKRRAGSIPCFEILEDRLTPTGNLIDFGTLADGTQVTDQYAAQGVTFSNALVSHAANSSEQIHLIQSLGGNYEIFIELSTPYPSDVVAGVTLPPSTSQNVIVAGTSLAEACGSSATATITATATNTTWSDVIVYVTAHQRFGEPFVMTAYSEDGTVLGVQPAVLTPTQQSTLWKSRPQTSPTSPCPAPTTSLRSPV